MITSDPRRQIRELPGDASLRLSEDDSEGDGFASPKTAWRGPGAQYELKDVGGM